MQSARPTLLVIGSDTNLAYLIGRYAESKGLVVCAAENAPPAQQVCALQPAAVLFLSLEKLEASQALVEELDCDLPLWTCSSSADETRARELGADFCLLHPLAYEDFVAALQAPAHSKKA